MERGDPHERFTQLLIEYEPQLLRYVLVGSLIPLERESIIGNQQGLIRLK